MLKHKTRCITQSAMVKFVALYKLAEILAHSKDALTFSRPYQDFHAQKDCLV